MSTCNLMDTVMTHTTIEKVAIYYAGKYVKLTDYEMRSDYENAKHVLI